MAPNGYLHILDEAEVDDFVLGERLLISARKPRAMSYQVRLEDEMKVAAEKGDEVIKGVLEKIPTFVTHVAGHEQELTKKKAIQKLNRKQLQEELLEAAKVGQLSLAALLIDADARVNFQEDITGYNALHYGAIYGQTAMCELMIHCGCKVDSFTYAGETALLLATRNGHFECVEMLAKRGANVNTKDRSRGWCALIWCAFNGHVETLEVLLRAGANREMKAETKFGEVRRGMKAITVAEIVGNSQISDFLSTWDEVVASEGALALELQNESDERFEMEVADDESYAVELAIKAAEEEAERIRIEEEKKRLQEIEEQRLYEIDMKFLQDQKLDMETRIAEAKEAEDWDLFESLEEQLDMLPATVEEYRERIALKLIAEQQREEAENEAMGLEDIRPSQEQNPSEEPPSEPLQEQNPSEEPPSEPSQEQNLSEEPPSEPSQEQNISENPPSDPSQEQNPSEEPLPEPSQEQNPSEEPPSEPSQELPPTTSE